MQAQQAVPTERLSVPSELTSPQAKLVYLYLEASTGATLSELQDALDLTKLSLYSILRTLAKEGLVDEQNERYRVAT